MAQYHQLSRPGQRGAEDELAPPPGQVRTLPSPPGIPDNLHLETGQAAGEDGSVAPIIGGLPAVEGSAWDIGAPLDQRGAGRLRSWAAHPAGRP